MVNVEVDTNSDGGNDNEDQDDDSVDIVSPERSLETTVSGVDGGAECDNERSNGRVDTTKGVDGRTVSVELDKHEAEHKSNKDDGRENTDGPSEPASDVFGQSEAIRADSSDQRSKPGESPKWGDGRKAVGGKTEDTSIGDDSKLGVSEKER